MSGSRPPVYPRAQPRRLAEWPLALVLTGVVVGLAVLAFGAFRIGAGLAGGFVVLGAVLRAALPERAAGLLVVRSRVVDAVTLALLGSALVVLALVVPTPS